MAIRLGKILLGMALIITSIATSAGAVSHKIRKGDTLWDIAAKYHTTPKKIAKANGIRENATLPLDKTIRIPGQKSAAPKSSHKHKVASAHHKAAPKAHAKTASSAKDNSEFKTASKPSNDTLVRTALRLRGSRYRFGGVSRSGFDCSGFTRYVYSKYGISLPHSSAAQAHVGRPVSRGELKAGDLVFFATRGRRIGHVGIYVGNNQIVHAATYGRGVRTDSLSGGYYSGRYRCARRVK